MSNAYQKNVNCEDEGTPEDVTKEISTPTLLCIIFRIITIAYLDALLFVIFVVRPNEETIQED